MLVSEAVAGCDLLDWSLCAAGLVLSGDCFEASFASFLVSVVPLVDCGLFCVFGLDGSEDEACPPVLSLSRSERALFSLL